MRPSRTRLSKPLGIASLVLAATPVFAGNPQGTTLQTINAPCDRPPRVNAPAGSGTVTRLHGNECRFQYRVPVGEEFSANPQTGGLKPQQPSYDTPPGANLVPGNGPLQGGAKTTSERPSYPATVPYPAPQYSTTQPAPPPRISGSTQQRANASAPALFGSVSYDGTYLTVSLDPGKLVGQGIQGRVQATPPRYSSAQGFLISDAPYTFKITQLYNMQKQPVKLPPEGLIVPMTRR